MPTYQSQCCWYYSEPLKACENSHAVAVITEWDEFKSYDWEKIYNSVMQLAKVFDGRNILDRKLLEDIGFDVYAIGKKWKRKKF